MAQENTNYLLHFLTLKKCLIMFLLKKGIDDVRLPSCFICLVQIMYFETSAIFVVRGSGLSRPSIVKKLVKHGSALSPRLFGLFIKVIVEFLTKNSEIRY